MLADGFSRRESLKTWIVLAFVGLSRSVAGS